MRRWWRATVSVSLAIAVTALLLVASALSNTSDRSSSAAVEPVTNGGEKWRIGYAETDPYGNFAGTLHGLVLGLERLGWISGIEGLPYTPGQDDSTEMWRWLSSRDVGAYIEFVADAHYSFARNEEQVEHNIVSRLGGDSDIDLMLVMGTLAGTKVATTRHQVPTLVFSSSNAVRSGIIQSSEDSGYDHIWAHMDPDRYVRQVDVFHDIFEFKKLGIVYENSELGRVYAAVDDVQAFADQRGVELISRYVDEPKTDEQFDRYYEQLTAAYSELAGQVDAMYVTLGLWDLQRLPELLKPFHDKGIPVFSQLGPEEVAYGALLSLGRPNFEGTGRFGADTIARVLSGTSPRELEQVYGETPSIVVNLEVADLIGYRIPFDILLVADEIVAAVNRGEPQTEQEGEM